MYSLARTWGQGAYVSLMLLPGCKLNMEMTATFRPVFPVFTCGFG